MNFHDLLYELSQILGTQLKADLNNVCPIVIDEVYPVQIEMDISGDNVLLGAFICDLPPGKFRENILKDALKSCYETKNKRSVFGYCEKINKLALFENVANYDLNGEVLYERLAVFVERVKKWKSAIDSGKTSPPGEFEEPSTKKSRPLFGI